MSAKMWVATFAWMLLVVGFVRRTNRKQHVALMLSGILLDILLVLYLQVTREAIQTAFAFRLSILQQAHIAVSTIALLFYFPVIALGMVLLRLPQVRPGTRLWHKRLALLA